MGFWHRCNIMFIVHNVLLFNLFFSPAMASLSGEKQKWTYGGFVDVRYQNGELNTSGNGFSLHDGAFQIYGALSESAAVYVDVPVSWAGPQDKDGDGQLDTFDNRWAIAERKAQLFISETTGNWKWLIGQFDSPLGLEKNDSRDLSFAKQTLLFQDLNPITHIGVKAEWKWNSYFEFHGLIANPKSYGSLGDQKNPESAVQFVFRAGEFFLTPGYYSRREMGKTYSLWNLYGGYEHPQVSFVFEVNRLFDPISRQDKLGYWLQIGWKFFDVWTLDFRGESLSLLDDKTAEAIDQRLQASVALKYQVRSHTRWLLDVSHQELKPLIGKNLKGQEITLALQQNFF